MDTNQTEKRRLLSLVVPAFNEEESISPFYTEVTRAFLDKGFDFEVIFIDDGSTDKTYEKIKELASLDKRIRALSFSRNFGKEAAMYAGLNEALGDLVCIIDADLQQRPEVVLEMLDRMNASENLDCVAAYQEKRKEGRLLGWVKSCFYKTINRMSEVDFINGASDFRLMKRKMVDAILGMCEYHRFSKGIFSYVGFNTEYIPYTAEKREHGSSKWGPVKLFKYALNGIFSFSTAPLKLSTLVGFISSLSSIIYLIVVFIQKLAFGIDVPGYATTVILILLIGGIQLFCLGIIGEYIGKIYGEVKNRPIYIIREKTDENRENESK